MTLLCKQAAKYGTDKGVYTPFYSKLLQYKRNTITKVLEIGIGTPAAMKHVPGYSTGASLLMWAEYFPEAVIYGMDKDPAAMCSCFDIITFLADQSRPESYKDFVKQNGPFDLIVDDGSHHVEHQITTAYALLPHLAPDGLYIIEDVNTADGLSLRIGLPHADVFVRNGKEEGHCVIINA